MERARVFLHYSCCAGECRYVATHLNSVASFLSDTYLPVAVLPALIAFPKNCKRKH